MAGGQTGRKGGSKGAPGPSERAGGMVGAEPGEKALAGLRDGRAREARPCAVEQDGDRRLIHEPRPSPSHADSAPAASMPVFSIWIPGTPRPKQSGRIARDKRGRVRFITHTTANGPAGIWHRRIVTMAREAREAGGEAEARKLGAEAGLWVRLRFVFGTAKRERWGKPHTMRPDGDNIAKLACDALAAAGCMGDDAQAARLEVVKTWGEAPGMGAEVRAFYGAADPAGLGAPGRAEWFEDNGDGLPDWLREAAGPALGEIDS